MEKKAQTIQSIVRDADGNGVVIIDENRAP